VPLNDPGGASYHGFQGGLYPGGTNQRPRSHDSAGAALATQIRPVDASGLPDPTNGRIVLLSIGMSNATQEFSMFKALADTDRTKNPRLIIVDGAQGGQTAAIISNPTATFWAVIDQRLAIAGVTRNQVQVAWVKEANANPTQPFPAHALELQTQFEAIARILKSRYPSIKIAYWASRTYGGYATTSLNPEPYAYESGFAVKWLIEKQINGDTSLSFSGQSPRTPWLAWGPYLWADGMNPRSDGLIWECSDFQSDGTHPSNSGRLKVARLLLNFFKSDPTARIWFLGSSPTGVKDWSDDFAGEFTLHQNYPNPFNPVTRLKFQVSSFTSVILKVYDVLGREVATLVDEAKEPGEYTVRWDAGNVPSGVYFYSLQAGNFVRYKRMVLIK